MTHLSLMTEKRTTKKSITEKLSKMKRSVEKKIMNKHFDKLKSEAQTKIHI